MKRLKKEEAITLRKRGKSYSEIRKILLVSKSTLSRWLKNIQLTTDFVAGLMLYWAEGSKRLGSVQFCNSDPANDKDNDRLV